MWIRFSQKVLVGINQAWHGFQTETRNRVVGNIMIVVIMKLISTVDNLNLNTNHYIQ